MAKENWPSEETGREQKSKSGNGSARAILFVHAERAGSEVDPVEDRLKELESCGRFRIYQTSNPERAVRLLKKICPDFVIFCGRFIRTEDGGYAIEI